MNYEIKNGILISVQGNETEITMPEEVHTIGAYAFEKCENLKKIHINNVQILEEAAFLDCISLEEVDLSCVQKIHKFAFYNCFSLKEVKIEQNTLLESQVFAYCMKLKKVEVNASSLPDHLFYNCRNLEEVIIGENVTSIDINSFNGCINIKSLSVHPNNPVYDSRKDCHAIIETKENRLFLGCKSTIIEASIHSIGYHSFQNVEKVKIAEGVQIIEPEAFYQCSQLEQIELAQSISYIGSAAFYQCESLKRIVIPRTIQSIESHTFHGCVSLEECILEGDTKLSSFIFDSFGNDFCIMPKNLKMYLREEANELPSKFIPFLINGYLEEERYFIKDHRQVIEKYIHTHIHEIKEGILLNCKNPALKEILVDRFMEYYRKNKQMDKLVKFMNQWTLNYNLLFTKEMKYYKNEIMR